MTTCSRMNAIAVGQPIVVGGSGHYEHICFQLGLVQDTRRRPASSRALESSER